MGITGAFLDTYAALGYNFVKCGEEARINLLSYNLAGGKMAKMRANINHANKAGLTTHEYKPTEKTDKGIEAEMKAISEEWLRGKKSRELVFTVGGMGLSEPMDRRYFYARDAKETMVAFNVFLPFGGMKGYYADVTRRLAKAPGGVTGKKQL